MLIHGRPPVLIDASALMGRCASILRRAQPPIKARERSMPARHARGEISSSFMKLPPSKVLTGETGSERISIATGARRSRLLLQ